MVVEANNGIYKFFDDRYRVIHHLLFWLVLSIDYFLWIPNSRHPEETSINILLNFSIDVVIIYINLYFIVPFFLIKGKIWQFIGLSVFSMFVAEGLELMISYYRDYRSYLDFDQTQKIILGFIWSIQDQMLFLYAAIGLKLFKIWIKNQRVIRHLENENLKTELDYLKSQINPHFLFNTLNNIYVQTKLDSKRASQTILKLSELLRYQLYECTKEEVSLAKEIAYLKNYLDLDRIRKSNANVCFDVHGEPNGITVYPFLFLPFFENAIKHGIDNKNESNINVNFTIEDKKLIFTIDNSKQDVKEKSAEGGLGLSNTRRRLELLYPDKHELEIKDKGTVFFVKLIIYLK